MIALIRTRCDWLTIDNARKPGRADCGDILAIAVVALNRKEPASFDVAYESFIPVTAAAVFQSS